MSTYLVNLTPEIESWVHQNCSHLSSEGEDEMCRFIHDNMDNDVQAIVENYCLHTSSMMEEKAKEIEENQEDDD